MKRGLYIGRFQPWHKGHQFVLYEMHKAADLEEIIIGVGSKQYSRTQNNPYTFDERVELIERNIKDKRKHHIIGIKDLHDNSRWAENIITNLPKFDVIYSGNQIVKDVFGERGIEVRTPAYTGINATDVRKQMITGGDWDHLVTKETKDWIKENNADQLIKDIYCKYLRPAATMDMIIDYTPEKTKEENKTAGSGIVLIRRGEPPYLGMWALPGGHLEYGIETMKQAAVRETKEETNLDVDIHGVQLFNEYSRPGRDPRQHTVTLVYVTDVKGGELKAGSDAKEIKAFPLDAIPEAMAFNHREILEDYARMCYGVYR